ncbi:MAG: methyltransferase [Azonexus sp.]|nr:class I SAM-dependent methyltransferase [Azonexus sp.]MCK6413411.1 methyltransferase [Azonexus sp.]
MKTHPLKAYWNLAAAAIQTEALSSALTLGIFEPLVAPLTADELAARLGLHAGNTAHLLDLLWGMGLLERSVRPALDHLESAEPTYRLGTTARTYFLRASPQWYGDAWFYRESRLRQAAGLLRDQVRQGTQAEGGQALERFAEQWAAAARGQLAQDQHAATVPAALEVMSRVPEFASATRLLDLGGGPGWVAIELARRQDGLSGVVFDFPEAVAVAKENIATAGLAQRIEVLGGDLGRDDIGSGYDLIWCSSVLHFVPDVEAALRKMHAALRPGGTLVCAHAEIGNDPSAAAQVLQYYLPMLMQGRYVGRQGDVAAVMARGGFVRIESFACGMFPMAPLPVVVGRKDA